MAAPKPTPIGAKFNFLTITGDAPKKSSKTNKRIYAECECGTIKDYDRYAVMTGHTRSCGCQAGKLKVKTLREKLGPQFIVDGGIARAVIDGKEVLIDADRADEVNAHRWHIGNHGYCVTASIKRKSGGPISLHRLLTGGIYQEVDHKSINRLDNRICNLRPCSHMQNMWNVKSRKDSTSKFKGVSWDKEKNKWVVYITARGKRKYVGRFDSEEHAAAAYDSAAKEIHGEFAWLNLRETC